MPGREDRRRSTGRLGEEAAARYLSGIGYGIKERNWRCRSGELDLVAECDGCLIFVEVRTRSSYRFGHPAESVEARKQAQVRRTAQVYLHMNGHRDARIQFDVVAVQVGRDGRVGDILHIPNAF